MIDNQKKAGSSHMPTIGGQQSAGDQSDKNNASLPSVSLPKGGGAIRGIGEKFAANPVTGTGSMTIPIAVSPGRSGFTPQLSLSYDSCAGNGPFGLGWSLSLPSITRKTEKGIPKYLDVDESDIFILSGSEDLVPALDEAGKLIETTEGGYRIRRYRPRIEGLFARIERWTRLDDGDTHWRSISKDNLLTIYGKDIGSRIADPFDNQRVYCWLICETRDDRGNGIVYNHVGENSANVDLWQANERNRGDSESPLRKVNRHLKSVQYGNRLSLLDGEGKRPLFLSKQQRDNAGWMFQLVLDYGDEDYTELPEDLDRRIFVEASLNPARSKLWPVRPDPFSSYRPGFEIRTYRLCRRILMFHHFPEALGTEDSLVRSTEFRYRQTPIASFIDSVTQSGYIRREDGKWLKKSLPPVEFKYSEPTIEEVVRDVEAGTLENLPAGIDGLTYQWVDLDGDGAGGVLTEQADAWFYKRNLSPVHMAIDADQTRAIAKLGPVEMVASLPSFKGLRSGEMEFLDLAGDGRPDLATFDGPTPGFYEHEENGGWSSHRAFASLPNLDWRNTNLKFIDLTGDGLADLLIAEDQTFLWYPSLAETGFGEGERSPQSLDEEKGPKLVFADGEQSIFLADFSGDGLTDLVRIRNGEVCYWPNLGYGRFGARVTMDDCPWFDEPDQFDRRRILLADIDGSGATDIIYLHRGGVRLYFNQSGNRWSKPQILRVFPNTDQLTSVFAVDLLGNGTACLVWSSLSPGDSRQTLRYVDLMSGRKPHLLVQMINNLGAETMIQYAPSTRFYLRDKLEGRPWITRLPFPVHCVEKITVTDKWRGTTFSTSYSYHHGYFDGQEREFRGFGRIEQIDVESYGEFAQGNSASPYITADKTLYQPPIKTVTWRHTGALLDRQRLLSQFEHEYFPRWIEASSEARILGDFRETPLPSPDPEMNDPSGEEWREAARACKGMLLRQEVYELDVDALEKGKSLPVKLFSSTYHNCLIRRLQPRSFNPYAVFLGAENEALTYHYDLDLRGETLRPDPRIAHTLNLRFDEYGHVLQSLSVVYPRLERVEDGSLSADALAFIRKAQQESHLTYTETHYTHDFDKDHNFRLRAACEVLTYELTGIAPMDAGHRCFTLDELRRFRLNKEQPAEGLILVAEIPYHHLPSGNSPEKRLIEHGRTLFFDEDSPGLNDSLPFRKLGRLGLLYENYKLALTTELLDAVFSDVAGNKLDRVVQNDLTPRQLLNDPKVSGYLSGASLADRFTPVPPADLAGQYWMRSGITGFRPDADKHFYLPTRFTDAFGNVTSIEYDSRDLFIASTTDPFNNVTRVTQFDFRALAPREIKDINDNLTEAFFDALGLPAALAVKGKGDQADNLLGFDDALANPSAEELETFFNAAAYNEAPARRWLGNATARNVYSFGETRTADGAIVWGARPACACSVFRERHVRDLAPGEQSPLQTVFEYSDGLNNVVLRKTQAEPETAGQPLRWIVDGKTILNNKGKPVKQYEPYFSSVESAHRFEETREEGVSPVFYHDASGRTARIESPDGSYSRVEFTPWQTTSYDLNDTIKEAGNVWFARKTAPEASPEERSAADRAAEHADTPSIFMHDSLGRPVVSIQHNRVRNNAGELKDEKYLSLIRLDAEGKPLWVRDARKNLAAQFISPPATNNQSSDPVAGFVPCYDMSGASLFQRSLDAGDRWALNNVAGDLMLAWTNRGYIFRIEYDQLRRPIASVVIGSDQQNPNRAIQFKKIVYGDAPGNGLTDGQKTQLNLRGKPYKHHDASGLIISMGRNPATGLDEGFDFKGNLLRGAGQLIRDYTSIPDWSQNPPVEPEIFANSARYDALNRPVQIVAPHSDRPGSKLHITRPGYNEAGLLERVDLWLEQESEPSTLLELNTASRRLVTDIDYNAKGQRLKIEQGEGSGRTITTYEYDSETFRLARRLTMRPNHPDPDRRKLQDLSYTYDPVGNITHIRDRAQDRVFHSNACVEPGAEYRYDALYRLVAAGGREHRGGDQQPNWDEGVRAVQSIPNDCQALRNYVETYRYDPVGNILQMRRHQGRNLDQPGQVIWNRRYQYALDSNRLLASSLPADPDNLPEYSATPGYASKYAYDQHGNMISVPHIPMMEWDFLDQLHSTQRQIVNNGPGERTFYVYDAGGQRVRKVTERQNGLRKDERIYLGGLEIFRRYNGDGQTVTLERETLNVMDDRQRVAMIEIRARSEGADDSPRLLVRYQFGDHLGSTMLEVDDQADVISYEEYHPYGSAAYLASRSQTETPSRYRFTGKERDEETGLSYHGARYYAPWLGRWTSCDPAGLVDGPNLYVYGRCNPVRNLDPSGAQCVDIIGWGKPGEDTIIHQCQTDPYKGGSVPNASLSGPSAVKTSKPPPAVAKPKPPAKPAASQKPVPKRQQTTFFAGLVDESVTAVEEKAAQVVTPYTDVAKSYKEGGILEAGKTAAKWEIKFSPPVMVYRIVTSVPELAENFSDEFGKAVMEPNDYEAGRHAARAADAAMNFTATVIGIAEAGSGLVKPAKPIETPPLEFEDPWEGSVGAAKARPDVFERYVSEAEAQQILKTGKLEPRVSPKGNIDKSPKRVGEPGTIDPSKLGSRKSYSYKVTIKTKPGTSDWVQKNAVEIEGEPGRYEIPQGKALDFFNGQILKFEIEKVR
jgi:RHS repeat-associated protein